MSEPPPSPYDCQSCGACCTTSPDHLAYVNLSDNDVDRLRGTDVPIVHQEQGYSDPPEVLIKLGTKLDARGRRVCAGLDGEAGKHCECRIYEQRPFACRAFEAGGLLCRLTRQEMGLPV